MEKEEALKYLTLKVAYANYQSIELTKKVPALQENTQGILERTLEAVEVLGMKEFYTRELRAWLNEYTIP